MSKRKDLEKIREAIQELQASQDKLMHQQDDLHIKVSDLICKIIQEEELLKDTEWEFVPSSFAIDYIGDVDDPTFKKIIALSTNDYIWINMDEGITFSIDEKYMSISFDELHKIIPFINKFQLKISGKTILDRLRSLKREASQLEKICHQFSIKD